MLETIEKIFGEIDSSTFNFMQSIANNFLTVLCKIITLIGEKGLIFFVASIVLMLFSKTRKFGICMFGAVACGALLTNVVLKNVVERVRPFEYSAEYREAWQLLGSPKEDGFSFPSGHVTAIMSAMTVTFIFCNKKCSWVGFIGVLIMGFARVYLYAHYFSDVIAGILVGLIAGILAWIITKILYRIINKYSHKKFFSFVLYSDIKNIFKKK